MAQLQPETRPPRFPHHAPWTLPVNPLPDGRWGAGRGTGVRDGGAGEACQGLCSLLINRGNKQARLVGERQISGGGGRPIVPAASRPAANGGTFVNMIMSINHRKCLHLPPLNYWYLRPLRAPSPARRPSRPPINPQSRRDKAECPPSRYLGVYVSLALITNMLGYQDVRVGGARHGTSGLGTLVLAAVVALCPRRDRAAVG